ncbi:hypothetical protein ACM64Y_00640 [Novispirillum sp. DQ9]|uniref:hypothetical protein n=1 Tax=Novispirillum sp. DQ9 TaxID=3398612 RepID=UPI003C7DC58E
MAKISAFKIDSKARQEGEWVRLGGEFEDIEIHTRALTDAYHDAVANKLRKAARGFGGDENQVPTAHRRKINVDCLIAHALLEPAVRNLKDDQGNDVTHGQFLDMLRDPDYLPLVTACFMAAARVGTMVEQDVEDAEGN